MPHPDAVKPGARAWLVRACVALPLLMLAANVLAWLRWGIDMPFFDDWRAYDDREALSLSPARLFEAINNTISPIGIALDVAVQRVFAGNALPYQTLSMLGVLGGLLWLQWRLLGWVVANRLQQAVLFAFCFPMLQSGSYWGEQSLAYQQALPLLALLGATSVLAFARGGPARSFGLIFGLGLLAGFSYISGAIGAVVMGMAWWALGMRLRRFSGDVLAARLRLGGQALLLAGVPVSALQIYLTRIADQPRYQSFMEIAWPHRLDFWAYLSGKIGRATGHPFATTGLELAWVALLVLLLVAAAGLSLRDVFTRARAPGASVSEAEGKSRLAVVFVPLCVVVLAYLMLVGMGRAGLRDDSVSTLTDVFRFGYGRFHFFWVTLLLPWLAAGMSLRVREPARRTPVLLVALVLGVGLGWVRGVFDVSDFYRGGAQFRSTELKCIASQLGTGQPIQCSGYQHIGIPDLSRAYAYARDIHASFVRALPMVEPGDFGEPLLHWRSPDAFARATWQNARPSAGGWFESDADPQMWISLDDVPRLSRCRTLGVQIGMAGAPIGGVQVFYRSVGETSFSEPHSVYKPYPVGQPGQTLRFSLDDPHGFEAQLRIDPAEGASRFRLDELLITCRMWRLP